MSPKNKLKFLDAISTDLPTTRSAARKANSTTSIISEAAAAAAVTTTSSNATDASTFLSPPPTPASLDPPSLSSAPAPKAHTERSAEVRQQQASATKIKKEFIIRSTERIDDADSFDALAEVFGDVLQWTQLNKTISQEFWKVLKAIQERLANHLTIVPPSFSNLYRRL
ncbi:hypothetical protein B0H11DRAFT_1904368 [Mycena galericulata]|nr:hypothetical protein B0H11DRAFT_1904368 [Mycena galericulata]